MTEPYDSAVDCERSYDAAIAEMRRRYIAGRRAGESAREWLERTEGTEAG